MLLVSAYWLCVFLSTFVWSQPTYKLDTTWGPDWPSSMEIFGVTAVATVQKGPSGGKEIHIAQRDPKSPAVLVFDINGKFLRSWGTDGIDKAHGLKAQITSEATYLWLTDVGNGDYGHTVKKYSLDGKLMLTIGTPGEAGTGKDPIQFGNVADVAFDQKGNMFISDGDGGVNNRVVKFNSDLKVEYIIEHDFLHPHSVDYDQWDRLWVADRENNQTQVFNGLTGEYLGSWNCVQKATGDGRPWGLRILGNTIFLADGNHGTLLLLNLTGPSFDSTCHQIQALPINIAKLGIPHEMSVDPSTGNVYIAEVGDPKPPTNCQRFVPV